MKSSWTIPNPERWCCQSAALNTPENLENSAVATVLEKVSFHSNPKERQCQRMLNCTIALILHASKVMLKILQARLQQYVNRELPDVQDGFRKGRGTRNQIAKIHWIIKKAREFQLYWQCKTHALASCHKTFIFYMLFSTFSSVNSLWEHWSVSNARPPMEII